MSLNAVFPKLPDNHDRAHSLLKARFKSTNHKGNVIDVLRQIYNKPVSLADIGINAARNTKIRTTITELSPNISEKDERRRKLEAQVAELRASECYG